MSNSKNRNSGAKGLKGGLLTLSALAAVLAPQLISTDAEARSRRRATDQKREEFLEDMNVWMD